MSPTTASILDASMREFVLRSVLRRVDILKLSHRGENTSVVIGFADYARARAAIESFGLAIVRDQGGGVAGEIIALEVAGSSFVAESTP